MSLLENLNVRESGKLEEHSLGGATADDLQVEASPSRAEPVVDVHGQWTRKRQQRSLWVVNNADVEFEKRLACLVDRAPFKLACNELVALPAAREQTRTRNKNSFAKAVEKSPARLDGGRRLIQSRGERTGVNNHSHFVAPLQANDLGDGEATHARVA